jgi:transposase InsO family protein
LPGDFIADRPVNSFIHPAGLPIITTSSIEVLRRPRESAQFVSLTFGQQARKAGIAQSMGSKGDCFDNAVAESFFATLKKELVHRRAWPSKAELRTEVFDYIEVFYNRERRHSTLGQRSPVDVENSTLSPSGSARAASRLASLDQINIMSDSPAAQVA